jgi:hypothetical protein
VTANDRLDVHFQRPDGMWLTVLSFQPRAVDLELFADVKAEWMEDQRQKFEWFVQETQKLARRHC